MSGTNTSSTSNSRPIQMESFTVDSETCKYTDSHIISDFTYETNVIQNNVIKPTKTQMKFKTERKVGKTGVMLIGMGGNNGTTCIAGSIANRLDLQWNTKEGTHEPNYFGSMMMSSTLKMGSDLCGNPVYTPMNKLLPMVHPNDIVWGGWDISSMNIGDAMRRAKVLDFDLQEKLYSHMKDLIPLPSIYCPEFIAANQKERVDNVIEGTKQEQLDQIRKDIQTFKTDNSLDKVLILWTANTERFSEVYESIHGTASSLLTSITKNETEISPSTIFAVASILEGCTYINGSPQNTFIPGVVDLAQKHKVFIAGDDFKSGQTKMKSVLVDFLVSAGIKPTSIVSYNHLGNNDGKNLSAPSQFRSKEISKSNVVLDMVSSNNILYKSNKEDDTTIDDDEHPDHVVVIKYVPTVGDSKRAMDEYTSDIFMNGKNTIVMHNTCEDSLLATPLIYDLIILGELCERISVQIGQHEEKWEGFHSVLSLLSYMLKAPLVPENAPIVNALFAQRCAISNVLRACLGLAPENHMDLEHRFGSTLQELESNRPQKKVRVHTATNKVQ